MDISLDNPDFQVDVADVEVHQADVPKSSSGSSSSEKLLAVRAQNVMAG